MQSIINSIIKNRNLIIYLLLSFISFNYLYNNSSVHYSGFGKIGTYISGSTSSISSYINSYFNLRQENNKLIEENLELKKNQSQFINKSDTRGVLESKINKTISAKVILNSINKSKNIIPPMAFKLFNLSLKLEDFFSLLVIANNSEDLYNWKIIRRKRITEISKIKFINYKNF